MAQPGQPVGGNSQPEKKLSSFDTEATHKMYASIGTKEEIT